MTEEHLVFTKINDTFGLRRSELESVKDIIHLLQGFERLSTIRTDKAEKSIMLTKQMKELQLLTNRMKGLFPIVPAVAEHHPSLPVPHVTQKGQKGKTAKTKAAKPKPLSKEEQRELPQSLTALEKQLRAIEGKLDIL